MSDLARYEYQVPSVFDYINQFIEGYPSKRTYSLNDGSFVETSGWAPNVDIKDETDRFLISADIPGVDAKDIEINMENGVLSIKGERNTFNKEARKEFTRVERSQGQFYRRFTLPDTADSVKITARSKNGVLEIEVPKKEKALPRKITVKEE